MDTPFLYLYILAASVAVPLLRSFDKRVAFYKSFKPLFLAILIVAVPFLIWDALFTHFGLWGFNQRYILPIRIFGLPLGEILFFIIIPYCGVFVYRVLNYFRAHSLFDTYSHHISNFLMGFSIALAITFYERWYTLLTFSFLAVFVYFHSKVWFTPWLGKFYRSYLVLLIPFFVVNGLLTGTGIEEEIVWYSEDAFTGTRLFTIPIEDIFYGMLLMLGVISLYEYFGARWKMPFAQETSTE